MIEPDDALIWARQDHISNLRIVDWGEHETEVALIRKGVFDSQSRVSSRARAYRAGQSAAAERIKALEDVLREIQRGYYLPAFDAQITALLKDTNP